MTIKQKIFVNKYIEFGNATEAAFYVYNTPKRNVAAQIGYENLRKPEIKQAIEWYFTHKNPDLISIVKTLKDALDNGTIAQRLRAGIVYFKIMGLYPCPHNSNN